MSGVPEFAMGQVSSIHDESWRAARLVVNRLAPKLDDEQWIASFHAVREIIAESIRRSFENSEREHHRLGKNLGTKTCCRPANNEPSATYPPSESIMRKSNANLLLSSLDTAADGLLDEVFAVLRENNIVVGLKLKREIMERVEKKLSGVDTNPKPAE